MNKVRIILSSAFAVVALSGGLAFGAVGAQAEKLDKQFVCHHTSSETNPVVIIHISGNAVQKHLDNHGGTGPDQTGTEDCGGIID